MFVQKGIMSCRQNKTKIILVGLESKTRVLIAECTLAPKHTILHHVNSLLIVDVLYMYLRYVTVSHPVS